MSWYDDPEWEEFKRRQRQQENIIEPLHAAAIALAAVLIGTALALPLTLFLHEIGYYRISGFSLFRLGTIINLILPAGLIAAIGIPYAWLAPTSLHVDGKRTATVCHVAIGACAVALGSISIGHFAAPGGIFDCAPAEFEAAFPEALKRHADFLWATFLLSATGAGAALHIDAEDPWLVGSLGLGLPAYTILFYSLGSAPESPLGLVGSIIVIGVTFAALVYALAAVANLVTVLFAPAMNSAPAFSLFTVAITICVGLTVFVLIAMVLASRALRLGFVRMAR